MVMVMMMVMVMVMMRMLIARPLVSLRRSPT
jgi:hypothetical protein